DDGPRTGGLPSTILDCTGQEPVVLRAGALDGARLRAVLGVTVLHDHPPNGPEQETDREPGGGRAAGAVRGGDGSPESDSAELVGSVRPSAVPVRRAAYRVVPADPGRR